MSIKYIRQHFIAMKKFEEECEDKALPNMVNVGCKFKFYKETNENGFTSMGYRPEPVYEHKAIGEEE